MTIIADEQRAQAAARSLSFYKNKAVECAAKSTSSLILDITKKAAIGAVLGTAAGAAMIGLHALDIYVRPSLDRGSLSNALTRFMPYKWSSDEQRYAFGMFVPIAFSEELIKIDPHYLSECTDFRATRCGPIFYKLSGAEKLWGNKPLSEWILPLEIAIKILKTMRWTILKTICVF